MSTPSAGEQAIVALTGVRKAFDPSAPPALDGLTVSVPAGHVLVLLGTSGSGKTTALKTINGLVRPDAGEVRVLGEDVLHCDLVALRSPLDDTDRRFDRSRRDLSLAETG